MKKCNSHTTNVFARSFTTPLLTLLLMFSTFSLAQSPKKLLENGFYEQAFVDAVYKQNKKVKLKSKFTDVIYKSYDLIYQKHGEFITSSETDWAVGYSKFIRVVKFRSKVKHPGVYDNLKNILYDKVMLDHLANKFNGENQKNLIQAAQFENKKQFDKALEVYQKIKKRHQEAEPITTLSDRISLVDFEEKITQTNQKIGDQYIEEASQVLTTTEESAVAAIKLIEQARTYRPLSLEEEELLKLANLVKSQSWLKQAEELLKSGTKKNARLAFELINKAGTIRTLSATEENLKERAKTEGTTSVLVQISGNSPVHNAKEIAGILNRYNKSKWLVFFDSKPTVQKIDFTLNVEESQPKVTLGDKKRKVTQETKTVEYYEEEIDDAGNSKQVKKTKQVTALVAVLSRTKFAELDWKYTLKDEQNGNVVITEINTTRVEKKNEYASLESGDILALPENIETKVDLDSQPFPTDDEMRKSVIDNYINELCKLMKSNQIESLNQ